jgi:hypothetical protein
MADFTHSDNYNLLPNLFVRSIFKNGAFKWYEIYPCSEYVLRCLYLDTFQIDEDGNFVLDENDNKILETPYRSEGGAMVLNASYDWVANPNGYIAELYDESMEVFGKVE